MTTAHDAGPAVPEPSDSADGQVSRRQLVRGVAVAGTVVGAGAVLAACTSASPKASSPVPRAPSGFGAGATAGSTTSTGTPETGLKTTTLPSPDKPPTTEAEIPSFVVAKTSAIPVGGGVVYPSRGVVVTQPTSGDFKCFNATCTHLGCTVTKVSAGLIRCPCHGAKFSIVDGSVKAGPAPRPLVSEDFSIKGGEIVLD
jgi:Rieske Fe-S protein